MAAQNQNQRVQAAGDADAKTRAAKRGELALESGDFAAQNQPSGIDDAPRRAREIVALAGVDGGEIHKADHFSGGRKIRRISKKVIGTVTITPGNGAKTGGIPIHSATSKNAMPTTYCAR